MIKKITLIIILAVSTISLFSQNILNSPYSRLGFGDIEDPNYMSIRQMGSLGSSWADPTHINIANPASLTYLKATAYEVGVSASRLKLDDGKNQTKQWGGKFTYIGLGFPLANPLNEAYENLNKKYRFSMAFDISRKSNVGYNVTSIDSTEDVGVFTRNYNGRGGSYEFKWANAVQYKDFSFGLTLGYLFGNTSYNKIVTFDEKENAFNDYFQDSYFVKGFTYNLGFMYSKVFNEESENREKISRLTLGLRANNGTNFTAIGDQVAFGLQTLHNGAIIRDTILNDIDVRGKGYLPGTIGFGANYLIGSKIGFGFEFNTAPWSKYYHELKGDVKDQLRNSSFVSLGGFYRPNYKSFDNYLKRVTYRYGIYYHKDPRVINDIGVDEYGVRFGMDLPFVYQRKGSSANIGIDLGKKGSGTAIEENFLKINFGFTFNDEDWFIKRKYN